MVEVVLSPKMVKLSIKIVLTERLSTLQNLKMPFIDPQNQSTKTIEMPPKLRSADKIEQQNR